MPLYAAIRRSLERNLLIFLGLGFFFKPEGRGFESLPACQLSHSSSRCCAEGFSHMSNRAALGAAGVPFGAAEVEETQVRLLLAECVRVYVKREGGV